MIPALAAPAKDENFVSWMDCVMKMNGAFTRTEQKKFLCAVTGDQSYLTSTKKPRTDYFEGLAALCREEKGSHIFPQTAEAIKAHTDLFMLLPFMHKGTQAKRFEYCLHRRGDIVLAGDAVLSKPKICPACLAEDMGKYGRPVIHIRHSAANACWKHGCRLIPYDGSLPEDGSIKEASGREMEKALFIKGLYDRPVTACYELTRKVFLDSIKGIGLKKACEEAEDAGYISRDVRPEHLFKQEFSNMSAYLDAYIGLITWKFGTAENFSRSLHWSPADEYHYSEFELIGIDGALARYRCKACGGEFYMHPVAAEYGAPCPFCRKGMTKAEVLSRYASHLDDGEFEISDRIIHKECGEDKTGAFPRMVWSHSKCRTCQKHRAKDKYIGQKAVNNNGHEMKIISFHEGKYIDVRFDNGEVAKGKSYHNFQNGSIARPCDKRKTVRIGEEAVNTQGVKMKIVAYRSARDIDVQFDGGPIASHKTYDDFIRGKIACPGFLKKQRIGETVENYQGIQMSVVEYRSAKDIDVHFMTGDTVKHAEYEQFKRGKLKCPSVRLNKPSRAGEKRKNSAGLNMTITAYRSANDMDVSFDNGYTAKNVRYSNFVRGEVHCKKEA